MQTPHTLALTFTHFCTCAGTPSVSPPFELRTLSVFVFKSSFTQTAARSQAEGTKSQTAIDGLCEGRHPLVRAHQMPAGQSVSPAATHFRKRLLRPWRKASLSTPELLNVSSRTMQRLYRVGTSQKLLQVILY